MQLSACHLTNIFPMDDSLEKDKDVAKAEERMADAEKDTAEAHHSAEDAHKKKAEDIEEGEKA